MKKNKLRNILIMLLIANAYLIVSTILIIDTFLSKDYNLMDLTKLLFCFFVGLFGSVVHGTLIIKIKNYEKK
jgi:uncharacterized membrane protein